MRVLAKVSEEELDFDGDRIREPEDDWTKGPACALHVSHGGELAAVANTYGQKGVVLDLASGKATMKLLRDDDCSDVCVFPLAFLSPGDRLLLIHGTDWNRLDISDARTGELLTGRGPTSYGRGEVRPEHYLDYFHCQLLVSPNQQFVADNGWVWHPIGIVAIWNVPRWLRDDVWESENGQSKRELCDRAYYWDGPLCWIDDYHLAIWGYGQDNQWLIPAVRIFDVRSGEQNRWFAGPRGSLAFDNYLFSYDKVEGTAIWDVTTGERLLSEPGFCPVGYHRKAKCFLSFLEDGRVRISRLVEE